MSNTFILSCESTVDLPYSYIEGRGISVIFYSYMASGTEYIDDMLRDPKALPHFYELLAAGVMPSTSQINEYRYYDYFDALAEKGDFLHISFGSGMTPSVANAFTAVEKLRDKWPDRKMIVVDSMCSSSGYGMLVDSAADMRDNGASMEDIGTWLCDNRQKVHHHFFSTDLKYFKRSGRVSGATAAIGTILNVCPVMRLDDKGHIIAYDKVRGKQNAIRRTIKIMENHAQGGKDYSGKCFICHSNCIDDAERTKRAIIENFPNLASSVRICDIGTIIASHCGPGTVAVFFYGDDRSPAEDNSDY